MPAEEIIAGLFRGVLGVVGRFFLEVVYEILFKVPGYTLVKLFAKDTKTPRDSLVVLVSTVFWVAAGGSAYYFFGR